MAGGVLLMPRNGHLRPQSRQHRKTPDTEIVARCLKVALVAFDARTGIARCCGCRHLMDLGTRNAVAPTVGVGVHAFAEAGAYCAYGLRWETWRKVSLLQRVVNAGSSIPFGSYTSAPVPDSVSGIDVEDERRSSGVQSRMVDSKEKKGKLIRWGKLKIPVKSSEGSRDDYGDPNSALSAGGLPAAQMHHHCSALQLHEGRASSRLSFSRASQDDVSALAERRSLLSIPSRAATPNPTTPVVAIAVATTPVGEMRHQPLSLEIPQHHVTPPVCRRTPTQ
ncbi:unnamed protein product [Notodromas monacha]|uniref:Uncharacterized protein n=1 Tax=Notodromas monacha TaxID=399045 RepID=A0A7R9BMK0_9CRUS|nr:unnamed protein product [Notodromas monacha]CAG0917157.1 unnamed protein product [Notodromas monacha]